MRIPPWLLLPVVLALCNGCGGGGSSPQQASGRGALVFRVIWPAPSRLIPVASQSIAVTLKDSSNNPAGSQVIQKPATQVTFSNLVSGSYTATATAFPNTNGTGTAQATGNAPFTINIGKTTNLTVTMNTTIVRLTVTPANPNLLARHNLQLTATAYDIKGNVVLISPSTLNWQGGTGVSVDQTGLATGVHAGTTTVTATETESNVKGSDNITVTRRIYFTDAGGNFIAQMDDMSGTNFTTYTGSASNGSLLSNPLGIWGDSSFRIYVADQANTRLVRLDDISGKGVVSYTTEKTTSGGPAGVLVDPNGLIYWTDRYAVSADITTAYIGRMADMRGTNATALAQFASTVFPEELALDGSGHLFMIDSGGPPSEVDEFDASTGSLLAQYPAVGARVTIAPTWGVALDSSARIYGTERQDVFRMNDMTGAGLVKFGLGTVSVFNNPRGMYVDADGKIYVADTGNHRIVRMDDMNGTNLVSFSGLPNSPLNAPTGIYVE